MVDDSSNVGKEPLVRAVSDPVYVVAFWSRQVRPPLRDDGPDAGCTDSVEEGPDDTFRVLKHNAAKSDVYGWQTGGQETREVLRGRVRRRVSEEESTNICVACQVWISFWPQQQWG